MAKKTVRPRVIKKELTIELWISMADVIENYLSQLDIPTENWKVEEIVDHLTWHYNDAAVSVLLSKEV